MRVEVLESRYLTITAQLRERPHFLPAGCDGAGAGDDDSVFGDNQGQVVGGRVDGIAN